MRRALCLAGAAVTLALTPVAADASTYCVGEVTGAECSADYPATGTGLQSAIDAADTNLDISGTPDTVRIGPGSYSTPEGFRTIGGDLSIVGSGPATVLSSTGGTESDTVLALKPTGTPSAGVSNLQIQLTGLRAQAIWDFQQVADVHIGGPGTIFDKGIRLPAGGRVARVLIDAAHVSTGSAAIVATSGVIEDTVIRVDATGPGYASGIFADAIEPPSVYALTVRHVSLLGDGSAKSIGVLIQGQRSEAGVNAEAVHVRDSLVHRFEFAFAREGQSGAPGPGCTPTCFAGLADVDTRYSSFSPTSVTEEGPGTTSTGPGNLADPQPNLAADGSPQAGSPLIDAGDPAAAEGSDSATDISGHPRILGGRRDIGAFEFLPPAAIAPGTTPTTSAQGMQPLPPAPHRAPVVSGLSLTHARFRVGALPRRGTTIRFTVSEAVTYTLRVERVLHGRITTRTGKAPTCRPVAHKHGRRCTIYRRVMSATGTAAGGPVSVAFPGRTGSQRLRPGSYRLTVEAHDATGAVAQARRIGFTVQR